MSKHDVYQKASLKTADNLRQVAQSMQNLSALSLPEITAAADIVGRIVPAGNVPGVVLSGLAQLSGRRPQQEIVQRDINLLFKGVEQMLDGAVYGAFFAGPAAVIWGYQNLLKLAGKDPLDAFPDGTWQFYIEYALREDTARHANETHGFDTMLNEYGMHLAAVDRATAWCMTAIHTLVDYDSLLENEWRERVFTHHLADLEPKLKQVYRQWLKQLPYQRGADVQQQETYSAYRKRKFDEFLRQQLATLDNALYQQWREASTTAQQTELPAYLQQMTIHAYLEAGPYGESRMPVPVEQLYIALIHKGHYYFVPIMTDGQPSPVHSVRQQLATLMHHPEEAASASLQGLNDCQRAAWPALRRKLSSDLIQVLDVLRLAPILINLDQRDHTQPLAALRQTERGSGDHALTLFDTGETMIFDQSHIFFDGAWGAALAEIMTNEAVAWAAYLSQLPPAEPGPTRPYSPIITITAADRDHIHAAPAVMPEASAENDTIDIQAILRLRRLFKQRSDLLRLTVNDLLVLYRAIHALTYTPDPALLDATQGLPSTREVMQRTYNPAILIPVDASQRAPGDRLYPMTFEVPIKDLNLIDLHQRTMEALTGYKQHPSGERSEAYSSFDSLQREYLASLAGFGAVMSRAKKVAISGESASVGSIKLLAHMPTPLQRLLDQIPNQFDLLNDMIKGREVFSNVGSVAPSSTLTRFISAKDDNEKKTLIWGVITDANGVMRVSLRDFRPHVRDLHANGQYDLANSITAHYLYTYCEAVNDYVDDLYRITAASRETRLQG